MGKTRTLLAAVVAFFLLCVGSATWAHSDLGGDGWDFQFTPYFWLAALDGEPLRPFEPGGSYLLILNMGDRRGVLEKRGFVWRGRTAFIFKNYLDRSFMRRFQLSGEQSEADDGIGSRGRE